MAGLLNVCGRYRPVADINFSCGRYGFGRWPMIKCGRVHLRMYVCGNG